MDMKKGITSPIAILIGSVVIALAILIAGGTISLPVKIVNNTQPGTMKLTPTGNPSAVVQPEPAGPATVAVKVSGIKTFQEKKDAVILKEDGKPVIFLFSTTWCPHCQWIAKTFDKVVAEYVNAGKIKAYHWDIDINDNTLTTEKETKVPEKDLSLYNEFNPRGSIPTFVFGAKYFRTGNGYEQQNDLVSEEAEFRAVIEDLLK
ncbi:MAG: thioredoxin domain-containing protein [Candidatus Daviesbacteria bacterium]|nr:thioredoxin domain-containing protein [Candidatus Daviesbacteria bacterium]